MGGKSPGDEVGFLGSFGWKIVSYDWLMVALHTIDQSELTLVLLSDPRSHCAENLTSFSHLLSYQWLEKKAM